ncbi:MAG: ParB/RepB/Spo0J family partition protein, partial [Nitrospinaceae bacterium]
MKRKALGRGLNALIPDLKPDSGEKSAPGLKELPLEEIQPGRYQPRQQFDDGSLEELAASIRENGVVQPIVVQKAGQGMYEIICGERRWRAAQKAGLRKIPVLVHAGAAGKQLQIALIENLHRQDLNPIEEAQAYQRLIREFNLTQEAVAKQVGKIAEE